MAGVDRLTVEVLADGTIKVETPSISGANHVNADRFVDFLAEKAGGGVTRERRDDARREEAYEHTHEHVHAGGKR